LFKASVSGTSRRWFINNLYADFVKHAIEVDGGAVQGAIGAIAFLGEEWANTNVPLLDSCAVLVNGASADIWIDVLEAQNLYENAVKVLSTGTRVNINFAKIVNYNLANTGATAVFVANVSPGSLVNFTSEPAISSPNPTSLGSGAVVPVTKSVLINMPANAVNDLRASGSTGSVSVTLEPTGPGADIPLSLRAKGESNVFLRNTQGIAFAANAIDALTVNYLQAQGRSTGNSPVVQSVGTDTNIGMTLSAKGTGVLNLQNGRGIAFSAETIDASSVNYLQARGRSTGNGPRLEAVGTDTNIRMTLQAKGTGIVAFENSQGTGLVVDTIDASSVNYLQARGRSTGNGPRLEAVGTDTNISMALGAKGTGVVALANGQGPAFIADTADASTVNCLQARGRSTGNAPQLISTGTDTNIDIAITPKGTGLLRFGAHTANADAPITGYIEVKDSAGNIRKLAVIA
jgi:hypothetical protein